MVGKVIMKTKEQISTYNKEYSARPEVIAWAKIRNARPERKAVRKAYKKSEQGKEAERRYSQKHREQISARQFKHRISARYGLSLEQYEELKAKYNGMCFLCDKYEGDKLHIDHCHETNKVRGMLCGSCNRGLGLLKDNVEVLKRAVKYLQP
jgi:hypothetical protein